jgi:hypothetical protein
MSVAPNHSANLPRDFAVCPHCGKKGLYAYGGHIMRRRDGQLDGHPPGKRCKYCRTGKPDMSQAEFLAKVNR